MHDEFLYDESLKSYHSHIYMLPRLWTTHVLYYLWALSVVKLCRPLGACHVVKSRFTCTFTHTCYFYSRSTIHIYPFSSPEPRKNILLLIRERIAKNISVFSLWNKCSSYLVTTTCYIISRDECSKKRKKKEKKK